MDYQDMGERIRQLRKEKKLSQDQFAEMIGISPSFLGHIERGSRVASLETLILLCNKLHVSPSYLLQGSLNAVFPPLPDHFSEKKKSLIRALIRLAYEYSKE